MFRLFGVPGIPPLLLLSYRALDLIVIGSFFLTCGAQIKIRWVDLPLLLLIPYPILIGIGRGNINITFFNDITVFSFFILKVLIFRTLIQRFVDNYDFDAVFRSYARKIIKRSILAAIIMLILAYIALSAGLQFYYQAPAELTFAAALAMAQGHVPTYLIILALAAMGGKRGILMGILAIGSLVFLTRKNIVKVFTSALVLGGIAFFAAYISARNDAVADAAFIRRLTGTWSTIQSVAIDARNWQEFLMFLDPGRFVEYVSLKPYLEGWAFWFGNGYGFRYSLDSDFLGDFGRLTDGTVTNAHFTPLAIVAKFGIIGLAFWVIQIFGILFSARDSRSYFQAASRLGFISMLIQSMFAFSFFISFFTPIFVAGATLRNSHRAGVRVTGGERPQLTEVK